jgi:predicted nucleic acid-binding protein
MILIDSNIWSYYFDQSSKEHEYVIRPVEKFIEKEEIVINTVIVMEVSHFLVKNLGAAIGKEKIEIF